MMRFRKPVSVLIIGGFLMSPKMALATPVGLSVVKAPATDALLSTTITELGELIALQTDQVLQASTMISYLADSFTVANNALASIRHVQRTVQLIKEYRWDDLKRDVRQGFYNAIPELRQAEQEWKALKENHEAIRTGNFWRHHSYHDAVVDRAFADTARLQMESSVYPLIAPDIWEAPGHEPDFIGEVERLVEARYARQGSLSRIARQRAAFAQNKAKLAAVVDEAENNDNAELLAQSVSATADHQTAINTTELLNQKTSETFQEERSQRVRREIEQSVTDGLLDSQFSFFPEQ